MQLGISRKEVKALLTNDSYYEPELIYPTESTICGTETNIKKCDVIHVSMVCAGYKSSRSVVTLLKSILFYRKHPLHFHIMVDDVAERILKTLFETWDIPQGVLQLYLYYMFI